MSQTIMFFIHRRDGQTEIRESAELIIHVLIREVIPWSRKRVWISL